MNTYADSIKRAAELIEKSNALIICAGAGIGVDSGLPDFRGKQGFWKAYPALSKRDIKFCDIANPRTFKTEPRLAWGFYGHRLNLYRNTQPHEGFSILKSWGERRPNGYYVFTSNVDGQFQIAGFDEEHITEHHGSIHFLQCMVPCVNNIWRADGFHPEVDTESCQLSNSLPLCPHCGGVARPNIFMFDDWGWVHSRRDAQESRFFAWIDGIRNPVCIEIGAGTAIPSVRNFSESVVKSLCGHLIRLNPRDFDVPSNKHLGIQSGALHALKEINQYLSS